jgi:hypothetical protein
LFGLLLSGRIYSALLFSDFVEENT